VSEPLNAPNIAVHASSEKVGSKQRSQWTSVFGNQRLTGALLDRLTHHVHILELNGESYRLKQSKARRRQIAQPAIEIANSDTAEDADS
jgi:hypothetical protein